MKFLKAVQAQGQTVISVTGEIGMDFRADELIRYLKYYAESKILLEIFSFGGSAFHALAIYDYLTTNSYDIEANIYGFCGSAATVIACAAKTAGIGENSFFFIHNAYNPATGEQDDTAQQVSDRLVEIYAKKTKMDRRNIRKMMKEGDDSNTMMSARQALDNGFVDRILKEKATAAASAAAIFLSPTAPIDGDDDKTGTPAGSPDGTQAQGHSSTQTSTHTMKNIFAGLVKALFGDSAKHIETDAQAQEFLEKAGKPVDELVKAAIPAASADAGELDKVRQESAAAIAELKQQMDETLSGVIEQVKQLAETVTAKFQAEAEKKAEEAKKETKVQQSLTALANSIDHLKGIRTGQLPVAEGNAHGQVAAAAGEAGTQPGVVKSAAADEWFNERFKKN